MQRQFDEPLLCLITSRTALLRVSSNPSPSMSSKDAKSSKWTSAFEQNAPPLPNARTCVEINQWSSRRRVDGVEDDATIQHERAVKF